MAEIIIVGLGNPYRGDDAAGWAVIDTLAAKIGSAIKLVKQQGDIAELMDFFSHYKSVYLIDAGSWDAPIGSWQRIDVLIQPILEEDAQTSTHGFGASQAISLAKNLDQLPSRLILYAINGNAYHISNELSEPVAKGIAMVAEALLNEGDIQSCMNTA